MSVEDPDICSILSASRYAFFLTFCIFSVIKSKNSCHLEVPGFPGVYCTWACADTITLNVEEEVSSKTSVSANKPKGCQSLEDYGL